MDLVLVVHGFLGKRIWMFPLSTRLRKHGFQVRTWAYVSVVGSVEQHGRRLFDYLKSQVDFCRQLHIVAHSMGSVVVRSALNAGAIRNLGRVVFIAPPNSGTPVARWVSAATWGICRPLLDISSHEDSYVNRLPSEMDAEVGIIAGRYDKLVPLPNTHLAGEREHIVVGATHNSLLFSKTTATLASRFITNGHFTESR